MTPPSPSPSAATPTGQISTAAKAKKVGVLVVLCTAVASVGPMLVEAGVLPSAFAATGMTNMTITFLIVGVVLAIWVPGYVAMTQYTPTGGAMYAIATEGLGRFVGVPVAFIALLSYGLLQVALYGLLGVVMSGFLGAQYNLNHSWWFWALAVWIVVTVLGQLKLRYVGYFLGLLSLCEIVLSLVLSQRGLANPAKQGAVHAFTAGHLSLGNLGAASAICVLGFIGFETTAVYTREVENPRRNVTLATYTCLALSAVIYILAAWAMQAHYGASIVTTAQQQGPGLFFGLGTNTENTIGNWLMITSMLAALLGYHSGWVRYAFTGARARMLPLSLAATNRSGVAWRASVLQSLSGLVCIGLTQLFNWNPETQTFYIGGTAGGFGILVLLAVTAIAIIAFFRRTPHQERATTALILPAVAAVALVVGVVLVVWHFGLMIGVASGDSTTWLWPLIYLLVAVAGVGWALWAKKYSPNKYSALSSSLVPAPAPAPAVESVEEAAR
ncbi:APC family permease [Actinospica durhamensis]|uniref:APC family permease n=1 Tax=Actinospica durhamensis TaxID=1508375 RepID=A0A941EVK9_9ACTN|nr:APC family permease [Actinospica durhamensis]MBR7838967.1 APC family permease [Actinospica durhamensis]